MLQQTLAVNITRGVAMTINPVGETRRVIDLHGHNNWKAKNGGQMCAKWARRLKTRPDVRKMGRKAENAARCAQNGPEG